ncbi:MAG: hypothetical protein KatS3mg068_1124 [Candidatus Sericytochromatia bacterium]|nr:MAG: hypothetical protein KatS3mg068_1124 [Candidatus Sericytochromatia bacterium]
MPNFVASQNRAKIASVKSNMRTLQVGIETFGIDYTRYPATYKEFKDEAIAKGYWKDLKNPITSKLDEGLDLTHTLTPADTDDKFQPGSLNKPNGSGLASSSQMVGGTVVYCGGDISDASSLTRYAIYGTTFSECCSITKLNILKEKGKVFYITNN